MTKSAKILVADHEEKSLVALDGLLKSAGFETEQASNGQEALDKVGAAVPHLCIIDPMLSGIDGFTVCQRLKQSHPDLPVIISTGIYKGDRYRRDALDRYGAAAFLEKPYSDEKLFSTIESLLGPKLGSPKSPPVPNDVKQVLANNLDGVDLSRKKQDKARGAQTRGNNRFIPGTRKKEPQKANDEEGATVRVSADDLKAEMEIIKKEMAAKKPKRNTNSRVKVTQSQSDSLDDTVKDTEPQLTSNDIFGSLIDDIESGRVVETHYPSGGDRAEQAEPEAPPPVPAAPEPAAPAASVPAPEPVARTPEPVPEPEPAPAPEPVAAPAPPAPEPVAASAPPEPEPVAAPEPPAPEPVAPPPAPEPVAEKEPPPVEEKARPKRPARSQPGEVVKSTQQASSNEYQLLSKIATGGMAEVWKAKLVGEKGFEKIVAIKKILSHLGDNEEFISMFIDEAKVAANLTHPNIAQIYELGKMDDSFFIAMEYVNGHNLRVIFNQCNSLNVSLAPEIVVYIGMKLGYALHYAHTKKGYDNKPLKIVHRDVSPQNILISSEGEIKLVDFGIAKASIKATQTIAGSLKGKLLYMSPEQADGKPIDKRSDIFSFGSVLYEALTGRKLFSGDSELSVLRNVRQARFPSPREANPRIPERVEEILMKALAKQPEDRYDSAKALGNDLKDWLKQEKIHINESDVSDYIKLITNKDKEKLDAFSSVRVKPAAEEAPPPPPVPEPAPAAAPEVTMPEPEPAPAAGESDGKGKGKGKLIVVAAGVLLLVVIILFWLLASGSGDQKSQHDISDTLLAQVIEEENWDTENLLSDDPKSGRPGNIL